MFFCNEILITLYIKRTILFVIIVFLFLGFNSLPGFSLKLLTPFLVCALVVLINLTP